MAKEKIGAVSLRGDEAYRAALKEIARRRKKTVGDLVREVLDSTFGSEITDLESFFATNGNTAYRSVATITKGKAS